MGVLEQVCSLGARALSRALKTPIATPGSVPELAKLVMNSLSPQAAANLLEGALTDAVADEFNPRDEQGRYRDGVSSPARPNFAGRMCGYGGGCCSQRGAGCASGCKGCCRGLTNGDSGKAGAGVAQDATGAAKDGLGAAAREAAEAAANAGPEGAEGAEGAGEGTQGTLGAACRNPPGSGKPAIELGELARHAVLLGDLFMHLYNNHKHTGVVGGNDISGPPKDCDKIRCETHLSHTVFVIRDPWDQPPGPFQKQMISAGEKILAAMPRSAPPKSREPSPRKPSPKAGQEPGQPPLEQWAETGDKVLDAVNDFCKDPVGTICNLAKNAGVPGIVVDAAKGLIEGVGGQIIDGALKLAARFGVPIPNPDTVCSVVQAFAEGDVGGAVKNAVRSLAPMALAAVGIPPQVTKAALDIAEKVLASGGSVESMIQAVGEATGAEGIASIAAAAYSAVANRAVSGG